MSHRDTAEKQRHDPRKTADLRQRIRSIRIEKEQCDFILGVQMDSRIFAHERTSETCKETTRDGAEGDGDEFAHQDQHSSGCKLFLGFSKLQILVTRIHQSNTQRAFKKVLNSTIATASFNTLSPKTKLYSSGSRFNSGAPKIDSVATGSTAEIKAPNKRASKGDVVSILINPIYNSSDFRNRKSNSDAPFHSNT